MPEEEISTMSITQAIHRGKHLYPEKPALVCGDRTVNYGEVHDLVSRGAAVLQSLDSSPAARVGILSLNSDRAILAFHAAIWAGRVPNYLNIRWAAFELSQSIDDFEPSVLMVDDAFLEVGREMLKRCDSVKSLIYIGEQPAAPEKTLHWVGSIAAAAPLVDSAVGNDEMAFLNYTGGTTGKSKGVIHTHNTHMAALMTCMAEGFFQRGTCAMVTPLFHISGIAVSNASLMMGNTLYMLPAFDPGKFLQLVQNAAIEYTFIVPTMIKMVLDHPEFSSFDIASWEYITYGASSIDEALLLRAREQLPGVSFMQIYGQTEGLPASLMFDADHREAGFASGRTRSAGIPPLGMELKIIDVNGASLPRGEVGEICMRGPSLMKGYLNMPVQSAAALQDGWLHTGDAGYVNEDDFLYIVDRIKDMIISGGENVYSAEVENALARHQAVQSCAVVGLPHEKWGEVVHADVVLCPSASTTEEALITHCREYIAGYKLPKSISFVEAIPLTPVGKVDKVKIRQKYSER
ncbi:AMP-binding protein [Congregibacter variabilis]|uniref:AMP-binding protein n=1 Tax=Congregibacter variabilis TaxID=3081200 RepID=A0ABZ0I430_9GAMM|nr:AMP-binding protein [Congregibacter sp. IMCC43200]